MDVKFMSMIFYRIMVMKLLETKPLHLFLIKKMKASLINIVRVHYQPYYSWLFHHAQNTSHPNVKNGK